MRKMTLKTFIISTLMLFAGWQSFAGSTDTVYALAGNKVALTVATGTDTAIWTDASTNSAPSGAGVYFVDSAHSVLHIDGTVTNNPYVQGGTLADSTTNAVVKQFIYHIQLKNPGGCISDDTSTIVVYLMPNMVIPVANADTAAKYCANDTTGVTLNATMPTFSGMPSFVTTTDFKWYLGSSTTPISTGFSGTQNMTLAVTSPSTASTDTYKAETSYSLPSGHSLVVSLTGGGENKFSGTADVTAGAAPTAPTLTGSGGSGSGF